MPNINAPFQGLPRKAAEQRSVQRMGQESRRSAQRNTVLTRRCRASVVITGSAAAFAAEAAGAAQGA